MRPIRSEGAGRTETFVRGIASMETYSSSTQRGDEVEFLEYENEIYPPAPVNGLLLEPPALP